MSFLLGPVIIFLVLLVLLLGLSIGVAFLLHWLLPAVGMDMALLVAVIAIAQAMLLVGRLMAALPTVLEPEQEDEPSVYVVDREFPLPPRTGSRRKRR